MAKAKVTDVTGRQREEQLKAVAEEQARRATEITMATQAQTAAQVENQIAQQRLAAGQALTGAGQAGLGQAIGAAGQGITAAMTPQQLYNQYASVIFGTPGAAYSPNFAGTQAVTTNQNQNTFGISI